MSNESNINKGVKKTAEATENFVNAVGEAIGKPVEAIGDGIDDALSWIGDKVGSNPFFSWLGGALKGIFPFMGAVIKGGFGITGGTIGGIIKNIGGVITWKKSLILEGIWDIFSPVIGTLIVVLGKLVAWVQSIFYAQGFERPLTEKEKAQLKRVFKGSLNYYAIRIIEGHSGLFGLNRRPFTLGNTIYMKTKIFPIDLLVHETLHAWQYQRRGDRYASDALTAQWFVSGGAYDWQKGIDKQNKNNWTELNNESQAEFFQDLWKYGELRDNSGTTTQKGKGSFYDSDGKDQFGYFEFNGKNYTSIAIEAINTVRNE